MQAVISGRLDGGDSPECRVVFPTSCFLRRGGQGAAPLLVFGADVYVHNGAVDGDAHISTQRTIFLLHSGSRWSAEASPSCRRTKAGLERVVKQRLVLHRLKQPFAVTAPQFIGTTCMSWTVARERGGGREREKTHSGTETANFTHWN